MDNEDLFEQAALEHEKEQNQKWRKSEKWLSIEGITKEDLTKGSRYIEKLDYPPWDKRSNKQEDKSKGDLVGFGKHAHLTYQELKEKYSNYFFWALENIPRFAAKVKELKLL